MIKPLLALLTLLTLSACTHERIVYRPITVPVALTQPVAMPTPPTHDAATQRDVALFVVEQQQALKLCNAQLSVIEKWSKDGQRR